MSTVMCSDYNNKNKNNLLMRNALLPTFCIRGSGLRVQPNQIVAFQVPKTCLQASYPELVMFGSNNTFASCYTS